MLFERKKILSIVSFVLAVSASAGIHDVVGPQSHLHGSAVPDTLALHDRNSEFGHRHKMNISVYPVQMTVARRSLRVYSDHNQILPIYRQNGTLYMAMRLNKGVNWVNGLPRGQYFINNKPIVIK